MNKDSKVLILGSTGLVGTSLYKEFKSAGFVNVLAPTRAELNIESTENVDSYISQNKPNLVVLAAAKVGGLQANNTLRADFIHKNLLMQTNTFNSSLRHGVENFIFLGSNCIYPKLADQPLREEYLLTGPLEPTNEPYAIAKIAGVKTAESISRQHGLNYFSVMPTSLYGEYDNFNPEECHVVPGIINRMSQAVKNGDETFEVWGTGSPLRELMHADDLAKAIVFLIEKQIEIKDPWFINIGNGEEFSIKEITEIIASNMNYEGKIVFNTDKPNGTPRKALDSTKIKELGWTPTISFQEGIKRTIEFYLSGKSKRV